MDARELLANAGSIFASLVTAYVHKVDEKDLGADQLYVGFGIPDEEFNITRDEFETLYLRPALVALAKEFNRYGVVRIQTLPPIDPGRGAVSITLEPIPLRVTVVYGFQDGTNEQYLGHKFYIDTMLLGIVNAVPV